MGLIDELLLGNSVRIDSTYVDVVPHSSGGSSFEGASCEFGMLLKLRVGNSYCVEDSVDAGSSLRCSTGITQVGCAVFDERFITAKILP
jgi:hypothetical protein